MRVETLYVSRFRNLTSQTIHFDTGINEIIGSNAEGKTSILEAIHMLILGVSFRTHQLSDLVQHQSDGFLLEAQCSFEGVRKSISLSYDGNGRRVVLDGQPQETSSSLLGNLVGVAATLEDQELVFGPPSLRRRFLDEQIAQIDPRYVEHLLRYRRALSQRNVLLKKKALTTIGAWEEQLALSGAYIVEQRRETVSLLAPKVTENYHLLFPEKGEFSMKYYTSAPLENLSTWYLEQYRAKREQEMRMGATLVGPHRDDIGWSLDVLPVKSVASLGQARSVTLALRLSEWSLLRERVEMEPIILIDDAESTLDSKRKELVMQMVQRSPQVILTAHAPCSDGARRIVVKSGVATGDALLGEPVSSDRA
jgi:DNA replication and repair protein RecF